MNEEISPEALLFFSEKPQALPLYLAFDTRITALFPDTNKRVQKTQITYYNRHVFACVSLLRVKRKAELPDPYIVVTLGLPYPLESPRVVSKCEPYPNRWTTHIVIGSENEMDEEFFSWVREAYDFSNSKKVKERKP